MEQTANKVNTKLTVQYIFVQILFNASYLAVAGFASVYLIYAGMSDAQIGTIVSISTIIGLIIQPFVGDLVDNSKIFTEKNMNAIMFGLTGLGAILLMVMPALPIPTAIVYVVMTCCLTTEIALSTSLAFAHIGRGTNINFSLARGMGSFGYSAASFLLGKAVASYGEGIVLPTAAVLCFLGVAVVLAFPVPKKDDSDASAKKAPREKEHLWAFLKANPKFMLYIVAVFLVFYSHMIHATYFYQLFLNVGLGADEFGTCSSFCALIELPAMAVVPFLMKKFDIRKLMFFSAFFFVVKIAILGVAQDLTWLYIGTSMQIFSFAFFTPISSYYVSKITAPEDNNKAQSLLNLGREAGTVFAALIGGITMTANNGNPFWTCMVAAGVSLVGVVMMIAVSPKIKEDKTPVAAGTAA